jgi:hypothetical protein
MGMRKLRVLPVPVEAVARMSAPSSAGGMALAWTGVGIWNPAALRRPFSAAEMSKSSKWTFFRKGRWVVGSICISDESTWVVRGAASAEGAMLPYDGLVIEIGIAGIAEIASGSRVAVVKVFLIKTL